MKILSAIAAILFFVVAAMAQTNESSDGAPLQFHPATNGLSEAEIQGQQLVQQLSAQHPAEDSTQTGTLKIQNANDKQIEFPFKFVVFQEKGSTNWMYWSAAYIATVQQLTNGTREDQILIQHLDNRANWYCRMDVTQHKNRNSDNFAAWAGSAGNPSKQSSPELTNSFANSDFWICDLGLEFFHWPQQNIIKKEFARGRGCMVLESTNPNPLPNGYSKVDCWIDEETLGIVQANAYDARGKLLKEFEPKSFKKVNGQWQLQDMEIRNVQTRSRTQIKFNLGTSNTEHSTSNNQ